MKKFQTCLWFDSEAEEAANYYVTVFPNSKIKHVEKYLNETPSNKPIGSVITVEFELDGNEFMGLNGGSFFKISEAVSFVIPCEDQKEMDYYYDKLSAYPESEQCGWVKDKFGVSWQVVPNEYNKMMETLSDDKKKAVMDKLLQMKRLNLAELQEAAK